MQKTITQILVEIERRKREARKEPTAPILREIISELNRRALQELKNLENAGEIISGDTINDKYFRIIE
jgi:transcriptional accessory protein Tex/SPT6